MIVGMASMPSLVVSFWSASVSTASADSGSSAFPGRHPTP